jgi:hypothetical protein
VGIASYEDATFAEWKVREDVNAIYVLDVECRKIGERWMHNGK